MATLSPVQITHKEDVRIKKNISKSHNASGKQSPSLRMASRKTPDFDHQIPPKLDIRPEGKNCIRKFAFATRVGYHPQNTKVNQDAYILNPNI